MNTIRRISARTGIDPRAIGGLGMLGLGALIWVLAFTGGLSGLLSRSTRVLRADFASVEDIVPNDPVRVNGVQVGTVASTSPDPHGRGATVTINLTDGAPAIYNDASASIVWRTALGANDAIALDPGTRSAGVLGSRTLPQSQDANQVELDQITRAFRGAAQSGIRTMLQQLAPALNESPSVLSGDFSTLANIAPTAASGIGALRGVIPDTDLKNLVAYSSQVASAVTVGTSGSETRRFMQDAAETLQAVSANQPALRASIDGLGQTLQHIEITAPKVDRTLTALTPLVIKLSSDAPQLAPTLVKLQPTLTGARATLHAATPLLHKLDPAVGALSDLTRVGIPDVSALSPSLTRVAQRVLPGLAARDPEEGGVASYTMLGAAAAGLGSLPGVFDTDGHMDDLTANISVSDLQGQNLLPCTEDFSGKDFLVCLSLSQALSLSSTGGVSLLQSLARHPGAQTIYGPLAADAQKLSNAFAHTQQELTAKYPALGRWLFANHGGGS